MAFRIEGGFDPGSLIANRFDIPDPTAMEAKQIGLQNARNEASLFPMRKQEAQLQLQAQQDAAKERQIGLQERDVWQQIMGQTDGDYEKARPMLASKLRPSTLASVDKIYDEHRKVGAEISEKRAQAAKIASELQDSEREAFGSIAADVAAAKYNPATADAALSMLERVHPEYKEHIDQVRVAFAQNPDSIQQLIDSMVTPKARAAAQELAGKKAQVSKDQADTDLTKAKIPGETAKSEMEVQQANALKSMTDADWQNAIDKTIEDQTTPLYRRTMAEVQFYRAKGDVKSAADAIKRAGDQLGRTESAVSTAKATAPIKIDVAAATAGARSDMAGLTDDDYKMAGEQYARTGVMPAMGRDSITRGKIVHAANQWARDNGLTAQDLVTAQAAYAGDKESLKKFQAQRDQIVSFEQTAQKNLQLMLDAGKKLIDTGSPLLNKPLRSLNRGALGSDEQAAFDAAQLIATNEVAKVTSGGGLGGVLSDSARHEMKEAMGTAPTIGNMIAVAKILQKDMENRHQSMDATLSDIKGRIGGGGRGEGAPATSQPAPANALPNGGGKAIDKATAQRFYEAAGGDPKKAREMAQKNGWKVQ